MTTRQSRTRRMIRRSLIGLAAGTAALLAVGAMYQGVGNALDRRAVTAPGRFVSVDGHRMHVYCTGEGSPTVVLEAGATGFAQTWGWIQPELAKTTRVCSYDRAGMGWSEDWETGHDGATIAAHLRSLLRQAGEKGPFVLVGHSLGGSLVQGYTALYPRDVLALGFVDPSHPDQLERFGPEIEQQQRDFWAMIGHASRLARVGVLRATNLLGGLARGLPERDYRTARMFAASPRHLRTSHAEMIAWDATMAAARRASTFGNRPTVVISATMAMEGMSDDMLGTNHEMHAEIAALSTRGEHVKLPGTDHYSLLMNREHARETAAVLRGLIEQARSARPASR